MLHILSINVSRNYLTELLLNPSFAGALIGALLTGIISLIVFKLEKRNVNSFQKKHYDKVFIRIKKNLQFAKEASIQYKKRIIGKREYEENELMVFNKLFESVLLELNKIDIKDIPYNIYVNFSELTDALTTIKLLSGIFMQVKSLGEYEEDLIKDIDRFIENLDQYMEYFNKKLK